MVKTANRNPGGRNLRKENTSSTKRKQQKINNNKNSARDPKALHNRALRFPEKIPDRSYHCCPLLPPPPPACLTADFTFQNISSQKHRTKPRQSESNHWTEGNSSPKQHSNPSLNRTELSERTKTNRAEWNMWTIKQITGHRFTFFLIDIILVIILNLCVGLGLGFKTLVMCLCVCVCVSYACII